MTFADDVVIMGRRLQNFDGVFTSLVENKNKIRLEMNEKYTKFAIISRKLDNENEYENLVHITLK